MSRQKVIFIAYQDQENLGVGYLSSMLLSKGFDVETFDFAMKKDEIYNKVNNADPFIVGFSLIFQYHTFKLRGLAAYLRKRGIDSHFTVGGHYPSLRFEDILNVVPDLDSVVRFEGELTICELAESLSKNKDWKKIKGIAYRRAGKAVSNELRPLIKDLDTLPFPLRRKRRKYQCMGKNYTYIIASRGCIRNCSFCSIRKFYGTPPGGLRRSRTPSNVVKEIKELYEKDESSIFLFQDDDFFLPGRLGRKWVLDFISELEEEKLANRILWKISCRSDEVEFDLFKKMKKVGLFLTYLGIESGNHTGLKVLNKQLSIEDNIQAVDVLNKLEIQYDFGFMFFDPSSTFESIRQNTKFLRRICGDGSSPAVLGRTLPYAGTDIEKSLLSEERLKGSIIAPDYNFFDPRLDRYSEFMLRTFRDWMFTQMGMLAKLRWHRFEVAVLKKFYPFAKGIPEYEDFLREVIASSNSLFLDIADKAATIFEEDGYNIQRKLNELVEYKHVKLKKINSKLYKGMVEFQNKQRSKGLGA